MVKRLMFSIMSMVMLFIFVGQAADRPRFKVHIQVQSNNADIQNFIKSHIKRELHALGNVDIVDFDSDIRIETTVLVTGPKDSVVTINHTVCNLFSSKDIENLMSRLEWAKSDDELYRRSFNREILLRVRDSLQVGLRDNLDQMCKNFVVDFDIHYLRGYGIR